MDNIQVEILDSDNNIEGVLDVGNVKNFPLALTNSVADLTDINKKNGSYSTQFKVPSTKENDDLLEHLYVSGHKNYKDFDAEKDCRIRVNDLDIDTGRLKISRIKRAGKSNANDYSFTFFGENMDWALRMKGKTTQDLPYLDTTYSYDQTEVVNSWSRVGGSEAPVFSIINRGARIQNNAVNVLDLFPDYFVLDYLNDAFKSVGYNFESDFFNQTAQKQLMLTFFGNNFRDFERAETNQSVVAMDDSATNVDNTFTVGNPNSVVFNNILGVKGLLNDTCTGFNTHAPTFQNTVGMDCTSTTTSVNYDDSPLPLSDAGGNFASNQYVVPYDNKYSVQGFIESIVTYNQTDTATTRNVEYRLKVTRGVSTFYIAMLPNGSPTTTTTIVSAIRTETQKKESYTSSWALLQAGDIIELEYFFKVKYQVTTNHPSRNMYFGLQHLSNPLTIKPYNFFQEGDSFNWKDVSDDSEPLLNIVSDIGKIFNIYWRTNKASKTVYAEPRDDFYNALSDATNYTDRLDDSKQIEITYNSSYYKRNHSFKYKEDGQDKYLKERNEDENDEWMSYVHYYPEKFKEGTSKLETKVISATHTIEDIYGGSDFSFYTSRIWSDADSLPATSTNFAPRVLYFNYSTQQTIDGQSTNFQFASEGSKRATIPYAIPFPIVLDGTTLADVDGVLSFKDVTDGNGLWTTYYSPTAAEIQDGKRAKVNIRFDLVDYNNLDFRDIIYIDNRYIELEGYWRVEKINSFKPSSNQVSVRFDLIQAKDFEALTTSTESPILTETGTDILNNNYGLIYQTGTETSESSTNRVGTINQGYYNEVNDDGNMVSGNNLRVSGSGQLVYGQYNVDNSTDLLIFGTGTSEDNRQSLIRIDEDGAIIFNGVNLTYGGLNGQVETVDVDTTSDVLVGTYLVDTTSDLTLTLDPTGETINRPINIKKINAGSKLTVDTIDSSQIDDQDEFIIKGKDTNMTVIYDGANYRII